MPPNPETSDDCAVDAPTRTPNVRDSDLLPDELPLPNSDESPDLPKRAVS